MTGDSRRDEPGLTPELRAFIVHAVDSIGTLETLLFMRLRRERAWSAEEIGRELRSNATSASQQMHRLAMKGLLRAAGADKLYIYSPSEKDESLVSRLARQYAERKVTIISLIYERGPEDHLRVFSDAFKLRKD